MNATTYGLDVAKRVFQMYWVDAQTGEIVNRRFRRDELIGFLIQRPAGRVALKACGSGHWWARNIGALGHEVVLLHAKFIRPFVQTNKTDAADARAIWTAVHQPGMRTVAVKTEDRQAMLSLHRIRALLVKFRTMQVNQLRGLLYEFGVTFRAGRLAGLAEIRARMAELEDSLPARARSPKRIKRVLVGSASRADCHLIRVGDSAGATQESCSIPDAQFRPRCPAGPHAV
jgi:transposase